MNAAAKAAHPSLPSNLPNVTQADGRAFLYVIQVNGKYNFTGYGITTNPRKRCANHNYYLKRKGSKVVASKWVEMDIKSASFIEEAIKIEFPADGQPIISFRTEATRTELYDNVISFVEESLVRRRHLAKALKADAAFSSKPPESGYAAQVSSGGNACSLVQQTGRNIRKLIKSIWTTICRTKTTTVPQLHKQVP